MSLAAGNRTQADTSVSLKVSPRRWEELFQSPTTEGAFAPPKENIRGVRAEMFELHLPGFPTSSPQRCAGEAELADENVNA